MLENNENYGILIYNNDNLQNDITVISYDLGLIFDNLCRVILMTDSNPIIFPNIFCSISSKSLGNLV